MKVKISDVRLSFPDLFEATQFQGEGAFNFGASFLIPKDHPAAAQIESAIKTVATEAWNAKAGAILNTLKGNSQKICFFDGSTKTYDGYEGNLVLTAKRNQDKGRPLVLDSNKSPLTAADGKPYGGCFVDAVVEIWAQDNQFGKGIRATLNGVQFRREGDRFAAGAPASEEDFDDLSVDASASLV